MHSRLDTFRGLAFLNLLCDAVGGGEDPLGADQGAAAQVLVEGVDEGHLPAPLPGGGVIPAHYAA